MNHEADSLVEVNPSVVNLWISEVFFFDRQYRLYLVDVDPNGIGCDGVSIQLFYNGTIILIHGRRRVAVLYQST